MNDVAALPVFANMKFLLAIVFLFLFGCSGKHADHDAVQKPEGELLASIKMIEGAFSGRPKGDTGYFSMLKIRQE